MYGEKNKIHIKMFVIEIEWTNQTRNVCTFGFVYCFIIDAIDLCSAFDEYCDYLFYSKASSFSNINTEVLAYFTMHPMAYVSTLTH